MAVVAWQECEVHRGALESREAVRTKLAEALSRCAQWGLTAEMRGWGHQVPTVDEVYEVCKHRGHLLCPDHHFHPEPTPALI